jgi:hypothetical protein
MESLIKLGTDNAMVKRKTTPGQTMLYKTLHRKLSNMNLTKSDTFLGDFQRCLIEFILGTCRNSRMCGNKSGIFQII